MAGFKAPNVYKIFGSKNILIDVGLVIVGFAIIGLASTAGTIAAKYIYNNFLLPDIPNGEKVPY